MSDITPLASWEITQARSDFQAALMVDTCTISRPTRADNGSGMQTDTYSALYTNIACGLLESGKQPRQKEESGRKVNEVYFILLLPGGTDIKPNDRAVKGGLTYEVVESEGDRSEVLICEVLVRRVRKP